MLFEYVSFKNCNLDLARDTRSAVSCSAERGVGVEVCASKRGCVSGAEARD